jgi:hypothetical protein
MDAYGRSRGIALLILNLGTRWVLSGLTPRTGRFNAEEKDPHLPKPTEQGVGGSQSRSGRFWRREKPVVPGRNRTPKRPVRNIYS